MTRLTILALALVLTACGGDESATPRTVRRATGLPTRADEPPLALVLFLVGSHDHGLLLARARSNAAPEPTPVFELVEEFPGGNIGASASGDLREDCSPWMTSTLGAALGTRRLMEAEAVTAQGRSTG